MDYDFFTVRKPHLREIAKALQMIEAGLITKLTLSLPPRAGKSYIVSLFCAWYLGKHSEKSIMRNAYGDSLAMKFSYDVRTIIQLPDYLEVFPHMKLKSDKSQVADWAVTEAKQSSYFCAGVGGSVTGKGCDGIAILDDPVKNIDEGMSENVLEKKWQWYTSTHKSRMEKNCPEIQIATRWSKKDIIGRIEENDKVVSLENFLLDPSLYVNFWVQVVVPALDKNGESFCDEIKSTREYHELKRITDSFIWEAEFMQNPVESKGSLFPELDLKYFRMSELRRYENGALKGKIICDATVGTTDTADEGLDFLGSIIGRMIGGKVYVTDVVFTQDPIEVTEPRVAQQIIDTECNRMQIESNAGGKSFAKNIQKLCKGLTPCTITWKATSQNKETRILMKSGMIKEYFVFRSKDDYAPGSDYDLFMRQLFGYVKFGTNKHDDAADVATMLAEVTLEKKMITAGTRPH
jgi:predicted phage terminase large subunit-like protein